MPSPGLAVMVAALLRSASGGDGGGTGLTIPPMTAAAARVGLRATVLYSGRPLAVVLGLWGRR